MVSALNVQIDMFSVQMVDASKFLTYAKISMIVDFAHLVIPDMPLYKVIVL